MTAELYRLIAGSIGMAASLGALGLAAISLLRRPESASLFVNDRLGYFVVKAIVASIFGLLGIVSFCRSLTYLLK